MSEKANHAKAWDAKLQGRPRHKAERQPATEDMGKAVRSPFPGITCLTSLYKNELIVVFEL